MLDTNIVIYLSRPGLERDRIRPQLESTAFCVSVITYIEASGYTKLSAYEKVFLSEFFEHTRIIDLERPVVEEAIRLRCQKSIKLGDSIIAASALINNSPLYTRNIADFSWIPSLHIFDPLSLGAPSLNGNH